jgi:hypothetical protein
MSKLDEILEKLYQINEVHYGPKQAKLAILEVVREMVPLRQVHSITHGDITHPHETEEDRIHNKIVDDINSKIGGL